MTAFPARPAFTTDNPTQGVGRQRLEDILSATVQLPGAAGFEDMNLNVSGAVTPTRGTLRVDSYDSNPDTLVTINTTNLPEGSLLYIFLKDVGRPITVQHGTGTGNATLAGSLSLTLNTLEQLLCLQRRGTRWYELFRTGREKQHIVGAGGGEPAFENSWTGVYGQTQFHKDETGIVRLFGGAQKLSVAVASSTIFTLPLLYRPIYDAKFLVYTTVGGSAEAGFVEVFSSQGYVKWNRLSGVAPSTVTVSADLSQVAFLGVV